MAKTPSSKEFTPHDLVIIDEFSEEVAAELNKEIDPIAMSAVLQKLMSSVSNDVFLTTTTHSDSQKPEKTNDSGTFELSLPLLSTLEEQVLAAGQLDSHWKVGGDRSGLINCARAEISAEAPSIVDAIEERFSLEGNVLIAAVRKCLEEFGFTTKTFAVLRDALKNEHHFSDGKMDHFHRAILSSLIGYNFLDRISGERWNLDRALEVFTRLFLTNEKVRSHLKQLLKRQKLIGHALLSEAIARQGYRTLLQIPAVSEYEQCQMWNDQLAIDIQNDNDIREYAHDFVLKNTPPEMEKIVQGLKPKETRIKMEEFKRLHQWYPLAGLQRAVIAQIFSEASRFPFGVLDISPDVCQAKSDTLGSPVIAASKRRLNCLSGQWLIATLAMECGISYANIAYCHVNHFSDERSTPHGFLLFHLSDGTLQVADFGYHQCLRPMPLDMISNEKKRMELVSFFETRENLFAANLKSIGDPVRIHLHPKGAERHQLFSDFTVLSLDQAFASRSLMNVGLDFEKNDQISEAIQAYDLGLAIDPTYPDMYVRKGVLAFRAGDMKNAENAITQALNMNERNVHALFYRGLLLAEQELFNEAIDVLRSIDAEKKEVWGDPGFCTRVLSTIEIFQKQKLLKLESEDVRDYLTIDKEYLL